MYGNLQALVIAIILHNRMMKI